MKNSIKTVIIASLTLIGVVLFTNVFIVKNDNKFPVTYFQSVERVGYEPSIAQWKIDASPELALEMSKNIPSHNIFSVLAIFFIMLSISWIIVVGLDLISFTKGFASNLVLFVLLAGYLGCQYGAYSSVLTSNSVSVSEAKFIEITGIKDHTVKYVKDNENKDIKALFDKPTIR